MALKDLRGVLLKHIKNHENYTDYNRELFEIFKGDLRPKVLEVLEKSLSANYYNQIKERVIPINVLTKIIDKMAASYSNVPNRTTEDKYKDFVAYYEEKLELNNRMNRADEFIHLFKGTLLEPFLYKGAPRLRVNDYSSFLPWSNDMVDPTEPTVIIKFMGKRMVPVANRVKAQEREIFFTYSEDEFDAFDEKGNTYEPALFENDGINPFNVIPMLYSNTAVDELIPTQSKDRKALTLMISTFLTDIWSSIFYQCFSIIYTVDVHKANLEMNPNAIWDLQSDPRTEKAPQVGIIKPETDVEKVFSAIKDTFALWLETLGIKVGDIASGGATGPVSGVSKIIDEIDTFQIIKKSITFFSKEEKKLWDLIKDMHNTWLTTETDLDDELRALGIIGDDFEVSVEFDEPAPNISRREQIEVLEIEMNAGLRPKSSAIEVAFPDLTEEQLKDWTLEIEATKEIEVNLKDIGNESNGMDKAEIDPTE